MHPMMFAMAAMLAAAPLCARAEVSAAQACSQFGQAGMRECLVKKHADSAAALKAAEASMAAAVARWDEGRRYVKAAQTRLSAANAAFSTFSRANCAFDRALGGGAAGNALENRRLACGADMNNRRADELKRMAGAVPAQ